MFKLALDNQISKFTVNKLANVYEVVMTAGNMPDEEWIEKALDEGATIFVSPDLDIPLYLDKYYGDLGLTWIDIPQSMRGHEQYAYINQKLTELANKNKRT